MLTVVVDPSAPSPRTPDRLMADLRLDGWHLAPAAALPRSDGRSSTARTNHRAAVTTEPVAAGPERDPDAEHHHHDAHYANRRHGPNGPSPETDR